MQADKITFAKHDAEQLSSPLAAYDNHLGSLGGNYLILMCRLQSQRFLLDLVRYRHQLKYTCAHMCECTCTLTHMRAPPAHTHTHTHTLCLEVQTNIYRTNHTNDLIETRSIAETVPLSGFTNLMREEAEDD